MSNYNRNDYITTNEMLKETRLTAKEQGMTFKDQGGFWQGKKAYMLVDRKTGDVISENFTILQGYELLCCQQVTRADFEGK